MDGKDGHPGYKVEFLDTDRCVSMESVAWKAQELSDCGAKLAALTGGTAPGATAMVRGEPSKPSAGAKRQEGQ